MPKEYYRIRVALDPVLDNEAECIEYLESFKEKRREAVTELIMLGFEAKKGNIACTDSDIENRKQLGKRIEDLEAFLELKEMECKDLDTLVAEKDNQIRELNYIIKELRKKEEEAPIYDEISRQIIPVEGSEGVSAKKKFFGKRKQAPTPEVVKYEASVKTIDDYKSLEEYVIGKNLEPAVMTMIACAINNHISYHIIFSMIENGLSAKQMRGVVDLVLAKRQRAVVNDETVMENQNNATETSGAACEKEKEEVEQKHDKEHDE